MENVKSKIKMIILAFLIGIVVIIIGCRIGVGRVLADSENGFETRIESVETTENVESIIEPTPSPDPIMIPKAEIDSSSEAQNLTPERIEIPEYKQFTPYIECPLSDEFQAQIASKCEEYGFEFSLVMALIATESNFTPDVISQTGDYGLMQINSCNHKWLREQYGIKDILDPLQNIEAGLIILSILDQRYSKIDYTLIAYNQGSVPDGVYSTYYSQHILALQKEYQTEIEIAYQNYLVEYNAFLFDFIQTTAVLNNAEVWNIYEEGGIGYIDLNYNGQLYELTYYAE